MTPVLATTNSQRLRYVKPPLVGIGWEVIIYAPNFKTVWAVNPPYTAMSFSDVLNDEGNGSISFDAASPFFAGLLEDGTPATGVLTSECLFSVYQEGNLRFQWLSDVVEEQIVDPSLQTQITVSGPGIGHVLKWGIVLPPHFPNVAAKPGKDMLNWIWSFKQQPVMASWRTLLNQARYRGTIAFVSTSFDSTYDSAHVRWADDPGWSSIEYVPSVNPTYQPEMGANLFDLLNTLTGQDPAQPSTIFTEWHMKPGFVLDVRRVQGSHRESWVVFHEGQSMVSQSRTRTRTDIANYACLYDDLGHYHWARDTNSARSFLQRETIYHTNSNVRTAKERQEMVQTLIQQKSAQLDTWTLAVAPDLPGRTVFVDYGLGDWIGVEAYDPRSAAQLVSAYRVMGIGISVDSAGSATSELTLVSAPQFRQLALERRLVQIENLIRKNQKNNSANVAGSPSPGDTLVYDPNTGSYNPGPYSGGGGGMVFIQPNDPGSSASVGDFWYKTSS